MSSVDQSWAGGPAAGAATVVIGGVLGLLLCRAVAAWFRATDDEPPGPRTPMVIALVGAIAVVSRGETAGREGFR